MDITGDQFENVQPRGYSLTSAAERKARNVLLGILDPTHIKEFFTVEDKVPNFDGHFDFTEANGKVVGTMRVQIKKMADNQLDDPSFQFDDAFMVACRDSMLPVVFFLVDTVNEKAYWRFIDSETFYEYQEKKKGKTVSLKFLGHTLIDKSHQDYVDAWRKALLIYKQRILSADMLASDLEKIKKKYGELENQMRPAIDLDPLFIREIQVFIDRYNYALDFEFVGLKDRFYYDAWKIGFAAIAYDEEEASFALVPIPYGRSHALISQVSAQGAFERWIEKDDLWVKKIIYGVDRRLIAEEPRMHIGSSKAMFSGWWKRICCR